jgi:hypothetical protein
LIKKVRHQSYNKSPDAINLAARENRDIKKGKENNGDQFIQNAKEYPEKYSRQFVKDLELP